MDIFIKMDQRGDVWHGRKLDHVPGSPFTLLQRTQVDDDVYHVYISPSLKLVDEFESTHSRTTVLRDLLTTAITDMFPTRRD